MRRRSWRRLERQLVESDDVLSQFAAVRWFRPGAGWYDARMLATLETHGYRCALGSVYPFDPHIRWSWFSRRFILANAQPGSVVILHDWGSRGRRTAKTLSNILPALTKRGFRSGYSCSAVESALRMASISSRSTTAVPIPSQAVTIQLSSKDTCTRRTCG